MKQVLVIATLLFFFSLSAFSQSDTIFFNASWDEIDNSTEANFFRLVKKINPDKYIVRDYFINGQIQMDAIFSDKEYKVQNGFFTYYNKNGKVASKGLYKNGKKDGEWKYYFKNGNIESETNLINGKRTGEWTWYFKTGEVFSKDIYENDERKLSTYFNKEGKELTSENTAFRIVHPEGKMELMQVMYKNIVYPTKARENGLEGLVVLMLYLKEDGTITDSKIYRGVSPEIDAEVLRIAKQLKSFTPDEDDDQANQREYKFPVRFKLSN